MGCQGRTLVAGWFSFDDVAATAGDLLARDVACGWLERAGIGHDVAHAPYLSGGVDWQEVEPDIYASLLFVCGPVGRRSRIEALLERFRDCSLVGVGVSVIDDYPLERFDVLLERDSAAHARPDLAFAATPAHMPVAGVAFSTPQAEYGGSLHVEAEEALRGLARRRGLAVVEADTDLVAPGGRLREAAEPASLIARCDVMLTTRLHGMVLALRQGVPTLAVDPVPGGAKVSRQAEAVGWPVMLRADNMDEAALDSALERCLSHRARAEAARCGERGRGGVEDARRALISMLRDDAADDRGASVDL